MNGKYLIKTAVALLLALWGSQANLKAQLIPPDPYFELDSWGFDDTNWLSDLGFAPVSFANLNNPPSFDGNCVQIDSTNAAWLHYNIRETDGTNELAFEIGTIEMWVLPDWNGGVGPGDWGRLIDVGAYSTNSPSSWWSVYFSPDGSTLNFSGETNGGFKNYLTLPIAWDTNTWHFIALTYAPSRSQLYVDGQLATNGTGVNYRPSAEVISNGFFVGSDSTGWAQSRAQIDDMATYNYILSADDITNDYAAGLQLMSPVGFHPTDGSPVTPGGGGGVTNGYTFTNSYVPPNYGSNLWLAMLGISNSIAGLLLTNTAPDILYELQGCTNLAQEVWFSEGFVDGSELTNCVPAGVPTSKEGNLFLRIRSWADDTGTGIPDWWWLQYFGDITNVNAYAEDPAGDGYDDLQKFQMGQNPYDYYTTNAPGGFFGALDASGTNAFLEWNAAPGPVLNYAIQRGIQNTNGSYVYTQIALVSSNATLFEDVGSISNANAQNNVYNLTAVYPGGSLSGTDTWEVSWFVNSANAGPPYGPPLPGNVYAWLDASGTNVLLSWTPASGQATNYVIERGIYDPTNYTYFYFPIGEVNSGTTNFEAVGVMTNVDNWSDDYEVAAVYPSGVWSYPVSTYSFALQGSIGIGSSVGPAAPGNFYGYVDSTATNIILNWTPSPGAVTNYLVWGGYYDYSQYTYVYELLGKVGAATNFFTVAGAVDGSSDNLYDLYDVAALYPGGSLSQGASWNSSSGPPLPGVLNAYVDATGTNIALAWSAVPQATGYLVQRCDEYYFDDSYDIFYQIDQVNSGTTAFLDVGEVDNASYGVAMLGYQVQATYPNGGVSLPITATVSNAPPAPTGLSATVDATGTNALLTWTPVVGPVTNYIIKQGVLNSATGAYTYTQIGEVGAGTTSFTVSGGAASGSGPFAYEVVAQFTDGSLSSPDSSSLSETFTPANLSITSQLVRNSTGHWQLMFSAFPTNVQSVALYWAVYDYFYDIYPGEFLDFKDSVYQQVSIPVSTITNGVYVLPDWQTTNWIGDNAFGAILYVSAMGANGTAGNLSLAGFFPSDAPCYVNGQQHLKQNLLFELREATISQPNGRLVENGVYWDPFFIGLDLPSGTNYVESSFFHWSQIYKGYSAGLSEEPDYVEMDDLWPITANYELHANLYDPGYTGPGSFVWQTNLVTIPAPAVLGIGDPYYISQLGSFSIIDPTTAYPEYYWSMAAMADLGAYTNSDMLFLNSGAQNLYGLSFEAALVNGGPVTTLSPGGSETIGSVNCFYSQTPDPGLQLVDYYFAPVNTPGTALPGAIVPTQAYPLPTLTGFAGTNPTGVMVASVGTPTVIGGWAKFSLTNGSPGKFAYLGQYYVTNAFVMTNGVVTTNTTGVVSPYGDLFPTAPGQTAMVTTPDIDSGQQGTGVVDVISLNVDANHDGTMDFTYQGPDQTSSSRPFRFWMNDDIDSGDDGGNGGIPGQGALGDGVFQVQETVTTPVPFEISPAFYNNGWQIHGRRDLVDFFPVYLNIGSLFQSSALSAGISATDTNYQFILSQADGALRFTYTDLAPTNYMNFLRDTNESGQLAGAPLTTIPASGVTITNAFLSEMATNNQGIILVEAWESTAQPLVLTVYHGTNQIAQTQLYLSISGVEQMFRSKTILLNTNSGAVPDRLTDASVANEPDTNDKNFIFVHGYNVNPQQARGWFADIYKRMYWSGSHGKFYGVTWEAFDTQWPFINITPNLQTNIVNAFATAPMLANFLATLTGSNIVAAHSLGNLLVLSALNDCTNINFNINQFCMIDAAVPMEAIQGNSVPDVNLIYPDWDDYADKLYACDWWQLFPTNDERSTLTWNNRLENFADTEVYNFYSSGEEVLRAYTGGVPPTELIGSAEQVLSAVENEFFYIGTPPGTYTWCWEEMLKGRGKYDWLLGSTHGGWKFNTNAPYAYLTNGAITEIPDSQATLLPNPQLQTNAFFGVTSVSFGSNDLALFSASGSAYARTNRNRILSDTIPALTLPVGANPVAALDLPDDPHNFNMSTNSFENGWPEARLLLPDGTSWHHSDCRQVAYTFTHQLFDSIVNIGGLK